MAILVEFASGSGYGKSVASARLLPALVDRDMAADYIQESIKAKAYLQDLENLDHCNKQDIKVVSAALLSNEVVIYDNCLFSNYVYGGSNRQWPNVEVEKLYSQHRVLRFHLVKRASKNHVHNRGRFETVDQSEQINEAFREFMDYNSLPYFMVNELFDVKKALGLIDNYELI